MRRKEEVQACNQLGKLNIELQSARNEGNLDMAKNIRAEAMKLQERAGRIKPVRDYKGILEDQQKVRI